MSPPPPVRPLADGLHAAAGLPGFVRDRARSHGDPASPNAIVHGENLDAMRRLRARFAGAFACVYFDPPFNTGRTFAEYDDALAPGAWRDMIRDRLEAARPLLADHGAIFVEIDDTELGHLQLAMDEVFGRDNRICTITVVRSASTGHKARNRGPVNVTDFLLVYAKGRARWRPRRILRERRGYDAAYGTFVVNREAPVDRWRLVPLARHVRATLGAGATREAIERFAMEHAGSVARLAQPRYEAVSREAQRWIDRSRAEPDRVMRLVRPGFKEMLLRGGNRILFLADKVQVRGHKRVLVEPITNVWDDIGFQGIAREGGVVFPRNKKPERLLERIVAMSTEPGEWVLDAFLGSGTTAAVAHKMGRRWIGIERGEHLEAMCLPRLRRVVDGTDATGVSKGWGWKGGGGFGVYEKDE